MTVRIRMRGGREITGPTLTAAIRREFGRNALYRPNGDPNSPEAGTIVEPTDFGDPGVFHVLAEVLELRTEEAS